MAERQEPERADEALLEQLRAAAATADRVPAHVLAAAVAAFELRDLDGELAELVSDSAADAGPVLVRGAAGGALAAGPRALCFGSGAVTVDVEVVAEGTGRRLVGLASGIGPGEVTVEGPDGIVARAALDVLGRFAVEAPAGLCRLRLLGADDEVILTSWTAL